jgi:putative ABC transport system ATP-binding protein
MEILRLEDLCFSYGSRPVLENINYSFETGKIYAIVGRSGAGKTTLLSVISGLAEATSGTIYCRGKDIREQDKYEYRSSSIGVIFQDFNLLTKLTAVENVELSEEISAINRGESVAKDQFLDDAYKQLEAVGIDRDAADRRVLKLSGGQQQRVAIARALSYGPDIILADEPTGNLDEQTQEEIMEIMKGLAAQGKCVIIVTHSSYVAGCADERIELTAVGGDAVAS